MKKGCSIALLALGLLVVGGYTLLRSKQMAMQEASRQSLEAAMRRQKEAMAQRSLLPGDEILQNYALPGTRPQEDLDALAHVFSNLTLLIKGDSPFRMGANEEFAAALLGKNRTQLRFMSGGHRAFNPQGQLIDRWETPLYFHAVAHDRIDIRSAGPDRQMWTDDDIHRRYDGSFLKGKDLNPPSLYQEPSPSRR